MALRVLVRAGYRWIKKWRMSRFFRCCITYFVKCFLEHWEISDLTRFRCNFYQFLCERLAIINFAVVNDQKWCSWFLLFKWNNGRERKINFSNEKKRRTKYVEIKIEKREGENFWKPKNTERKCINRHLKIYK